MNEKRSANGTKSYDVPIPKPSDEYLEKFLRTTQGKFVTKRFHKDPSGESSRSTRHPREQ